MACCTGGQETLISELQALASQIGDCCDTKCCSDPCCQPCCFPPCTIPFAQVTMTCAPPILAPTVPEPVKPLSLPCPPPPGPPPLTPREEEQFRYNNFYNNYNIDYHSQSPNCPYCPPPKVNKQRYCEDYTKVKDCCPDPGCPTGFKPCKMKLTPPPCCDPCGIWCAEVQPCPPKPKNNSNKYVPGPCCRPCCKHWKPKEGPCLYDDPCKAHCYNHPIGMKPSGRWP